MSLLLKLLVLRWERETRVRTTHLELRFLLLQTYAHNKQCLARLAVFSMEPESEIQNPRSTSRVSRSISLPLSPNFLFYLCSESGINRCLNLRSHLWIASSFIGCAFDACQLYCSIFLFC